MVAGYLGQITMALVDTAVVGRLGAAPLGGGPGNAMFYIWMVLGFGILSGMDFPASHAFGAGRKEHTLSIFLNALFLALICSIPFTIIPYALSNVLHWFGSSPDVIAQTKVYLRILATSMAPVLVFGVCRQYLQILGKPRAAFWILIVANIINLVANLAFVLGWWGAPALGTAGSAVATLNARLAMGAAGIAVVIIATRPWAASNPGDASAPHPHMQGHPEAGAPSGLQMLLEVGAFSGSSTPRPRLGAVDLAVHQIVLQAASFSFMVPQVLLRHRRHGGHQPRGQRPDERPPLRQPGFYSGRQLHDLLRPHHVALPRPSSSASSRRIPPLTAATSVLLCRRRLSNLRRPPSGGLRCAQRRADSRTPLIANAIGHWVFGIPLGAWLCFRGGMGLPGLWIGLDTGLAIVAGILLVAWRRNARHLSEGRLPPSANKAIARQGTVRSK